MSSAELVVDEWRLGVETTADRVGCWGCGTRAVGQARRRVQVRDLPIAGRAVVLWWAKRLWRCPDPDCALRTWSERTEEVAPRAVLTEGARARVMEAVAGGELVAKVAADVGVSWATAMAGVEDHGRALVEDLSRIEGVRALGGGETTFSHARPGRRQVQVAGFVDLDRAVLLDVVPGRSGAPAPGWLAARGSQWQAGVEVAALDAFRGYNTALAASRRRATTVVDHFHAIALANWAIDQIRRRVQQDVLGHRGRARDPL